MIMRYKRPDKKDALSLLQAAEHDMKFTLSLKPSADSASTIVRNIYECFRMLGDALLISKGIDSYDHIAPINELLKLNVTTNRPIRLIENLRNLRHNINYNGYNPSLIEVEDVISLAKSCFGPLKEAVKKEIT